jgi:hypothetical protein
MYRTVHDAPAIDGVAEPLRGVVAACLDKEPESRPTPAAVIDRLMGLLGYISPEPAAPESVHAAETIITPVIEPAAQPVGFPDPAGESTQDNPLFSDPDALAPQLYSEFPTADDSEPGAHDWTRGSALSGRRRLIVGAALGAVLVVSGTLAALAATHQHKNTTATQTGGHASHSVAATPHSPAANGSIAAALPQRFVTGPGCAASPWANTTQAIPAGEQLVPNVGGGDPQCGGVAATFRKSGAMAPSGSGFTWEFQLRRAAHCTLSVYIANTNSSSGIALYQVTAAGKTAQFRVNQAMTKGQWVQQAATGALNLTDGTVRLVLTDAGSYAGDHFHVTASSVRADCS